MTTLKQAEAFLQQGNLQQAEALYRQLLQSEPGNGEALWGLGRIAVRARHYEGAIAMLANAAAALPQQPGPLMALADVLDRCDRQADAGSALRVAVSLAPQSAEIRCKLGVHLMGAGDAGAAKEQIREALRLDPNYAPAWMTLSRLKTFKSGDPDIAAMVSVLQLCSGHAGDAISMCYALGKASHDLGDGGAAFEYWRRANELDYARAEFTVEDMRSFFQQLSSVFTADILAQRNTDETPALTPIFIVGQPRSGSTLLESMLACHSHIGSAGEQHYMGEEVASALVEATGKHFPLACAELNQSQLRALATVYLDKLQQHAPEAGYIVDKLPANYQTIGLIHMLMPHAKVIHLRRHPMDVSFSIFRNNFDAKEPYFSTLAEIGAYHLRYEAVMRHWGKVVPGFVHELRYEDLVAEPVTCLTRVLTFCGLEWEPSCLNFVRSSRHISTLSQLQVRQPLNSSAVGAWHAYENQLEPLQAMLASSIEAY